MGSFPLLLCGFLLAGSVAVSQTVQDLSKAAAENWFSYSGSYSAQRHTLLKQVRTANVRSLTAKWIYHLARAEELEAVPVVAEGVMYVSQPNEVDALDARSGRLIWQYRRTAEGRGRNRGVAIYQRKVYL